MASKPQSSDLDPNICKDYQQRTKYFGHKRGISCIAFGQDEVGFSDLNFQGHSRLNRLNLSLFGGGHLFSLETMLVSPLKKY